MVLLIPALSLFPAVLFAEDSTRLPDPPPIRLCLQDGITADVVDPPGDLLTLSPEIDMLQSQGSCKSDCQSPECGNCSPLCMCIQSACQLSPHYMYFPSLHGYYYLRPYHHSQVRQHQALALQWGEDSRVPYANKVFQKVYAEYRKDKNRP
jgi:hypothetical protein